MSRNQQSSSSMNMAVINPMMMEALDNITPENLPMFLMGNPQLVPAQYSKLFSKSMTSLVTYGLFGSIVGIMANIQLKRISMRFLTMPIYVRYPIRLTVFTLPFLAMMPKINQDLDKMSTTLAKIHLKLRKLRNTGDIDDYFRT